MSPKVARAVFATFVFSLLSGCGQPMGSVGTHKEMESAPLFADGSSARPLPEGVVVRGDVRADSAYDLGTLNGRLVTEPPRKITPELLQRGQERYAIHCSMCHGRDGYGKGIVVQRGFTSPPSYHTEKLRNAPLGHFYDVITHGKGAMYSFAPRISQDDRWAIAAYVRVLQLSQYAKLDDVPPDQQTVLKNQNSTNNAEEQAK